MSLFLDISQGHKSQVFIAPAYFYATFEMEKRSLNNLVKNFSVKIYRKTWLRCQEKIKPQNVMCINVFRRGENIVYYGL
jgi:hypothetical protein